MIEIAVDTTLSFDSQSRSGRAGSDATHALTRKKRTTVRFFLSPNGDYFAGAAAVSVLFPDLFLLEEFLEEEEGLEEECLEEECLEDDLWEEDFFSLFGASADEPDGAGACAAAVNVNAANIMATAAEIRRFIVYFLSCIGAGTARHLTLD